MFMVDKIYSKDQLIKKSSFISYLCPISEFEGLKSDLRSLHPKASHIVWAFRAYEGRLSEGCSDDNEPKKSSGPPCLEALRGAGLVNVGVIVVRYFGGIKLGIGGLVRAYSSSVNEVIKSANLIKFEIRDIFIFFVPFSLLSRFEYYLEKNSLLALGREFRDDGVLFKIRLNRSEFEDLYKFAREFRGFYFLALALFSKNFFTSQTWL